MMIYMRVFIKYRYKPIWTLACGKEIELNLVSHLKGTGHVDKIKCATRLIDRTYRNASLHVKIKLSVAPIQGRSLVAHCSERFSSHIHPSATVYLPTDLIVLVTIDEAF